MSALSTVIDCDGCGLPASAGHIAARIDRLELATRSRPIHVHLLFVVLQPAPRPEDDFYGPPEKHDFFDPFLAALDIPANIEKLALAPNRAESDAAGLLEFQRRGYYFTSLAECPVLPPGVESENTRGKAIFEAVRRLGPTLVKRIRFNYRPKHVALLGAELEPLGKILEMAGLASLLLLDRGRPLALPEPGNAASLERFRQALLLETPRTKSCSGV